MKNIKAQNSSSRSRPSRHARLLFAFPAPRGEKAKAGRTTRDIIFIANPGVQRKKVYARQVPWYRIFIKSESDRPVNFPIPPARETPDPLYYVNAGAEPAMYKRIWKKSRRCFVRNRLDQNFRRSERVCRKIERCKG